MQSYKKLNDKTQIINVFFRQKTFSVPPTPLFSFPEVKYFIKKEKEEYTFKAYSPCYICNKQYCSATYLLSARATFTAQATVQPTIGLLPIPRKPIIST